jgi:hypothetical protein
MLLAALTLFFATTFPATSTTGWMRPEVFHLTIGMKRAAAEKSLRDGGWEVKKGKDENQVVIDYTNERALTLDFHQERLRSIRFELFAPLGDGLKKAFAEEKAYLKKSLGAPKKKLVPSILLYDHTLPNVMVVLQNDPKSENGKQGIGFLAVRYYDPRGADQ